MKAMGNSLRRISASCSGLTLIELLVAIGIMSILIATVQPRWTVHTQSVILKNSSYEIYESIKLARHLSVYREGSYFVRIRNGRLVVQENIWGSQPVHEFLIPESIMVSFFDGNSITFSRNGHTAYNRLVIQNQQGERYQIILRVGSSRVDMERMN